MSRRPLLKSNIWDACKVTPYNIRDDFGCALQPSDLRLQAPRSTLEDLPYNILTPVPKLFEHAVGKPMKFCIPIIIRERGKIAAILRGTGGRFVDDVADADYVVLGNWESQFFNDTWYDAQAYSKPTVMPKFVFETYERGILMDPGDYRTRGPGKPRRNRLRNTTPQPTTTTRRRRGRGKGGRAESVSSPSSGFSEGSPYWLRFFKDEERVWSLKYIGTLLKKDSKLTHQALAIYLSKQSSRHTLSSWGKYCLYHKDAIEDLRERAINDAEKKVTSKEWGATAGTEAGRTASSAIQQDPRQTTPQQPASQQVASQQPAISLAELGSVVKIEHLDEAADDFLFAVNILSEWNSKEEEDAALWNRMGAMRPCTTAPTWEVFCENHRFMFADYFIKLAQKS